jgi:hypothetical protein
MLAQLIELTEQRIAGGSERGEIDIVKGCVDLHGWRIPGHNKLAHRQLHCYCPADLLCLCRIFKKGAPEWSKYS